MACSKTHQTSWLLLLAVLLVEIQQAPSSHVELSSSSSNSSRPRSGNSQVLARCRQEQAAALLRLKGSFSFTPSSCDSVAAKTALSSWRAGTNCCHWEGISCDRVAGRVTALNLSGQNIQISGFHPALFDLTSLRYLNLEDNQFSGSHLPTPGFQSLTQIRVLSLRACNLSGTITPSLASLHSLRTIDLSENYLTGQVPDLFANFPMLETLVLATNPFEFGTFPLGITQLKNLKVLDLRQTNLFGGVPNSIGNLSSLTELHLGWNSFSGYLPWTLNNLTDLIILNCPDCGLSGRAPSLISLTRLEYISLSDNNLTGPIPLSNDGGIFPNLTTVDRLRYSPSHHCRHCPSSNNSLSGAVPASIFTQPSLQTLSLQMNNLSGSIEEFHNASTTLTSIDLSNNQLTGVVPTSFSHLTALSNLALDSNNFTGVLDLNPYFGLRNLLRFSASYNHLLSATADNHGSNASINGSISWLELASCNLTRVPNALQYLPKLDGLNISYNHIGGKIPDWIWRNMSTVDLSHNQFTTVGLLPANTTIMFLDLSFNKLRGAVPFPFSGYMLDYSNNKLSSIPPNGFLRQFQITYSVNLANNELSGPLPYVDCHWNDPLQILDLSGNNLSGLIPPYLLKGCNDLTILNLRGNNLSGTWSDEMDRSCYLNLIDLHGNRIQGRLPRSLPNCKELQVLDIGGNNFVDSFPSWLGGLHNLRLLILRSNKFYGPVNMPPESNHSISDYFPSLQILDLAENCFTEVLHSELFNSFRYMVRGPNSTAGDGWVDNTLHAEAARSSYQVAVEIAMKQRYMKMPEIFTDLVVIDLSNNRFSGTIPKTVGNLIHLLVLNMSHNALSGEIPCELGRLARVESLDLSWNHLKGEIPQEMVALTALEWLNLSYNDLSGRIPSGGQFSTFPGRSFQGGNWELYGCPLPVRCNLTTSSGARALPPSSPDGASGGHRFEVVMLFLFTGLGYGFGFALAIVLKGGLRLKVLQI